MTDIGAKKSGRLLGLPLDERENGRLGRLPLQV
jgi:hypothetical protein